jgi:Cu/Ag efflux protein CusF
VIAILPTTQADSRTLTVRIELPNRDGRLRPGMFASVALGGDAKPALLVPSEAVIRTGRRTLVMLAAGDGRYHPAEVRIGREAGGETEILAGLSPGENVVVSGQFLIDSEASLSGIEARPIGGGAASATIAAPASKATLYETTGKIERITANSVTLSHEPVPALDWPAMTMTFALANPGIARGFKAGDRVRFGFDRPRRDRRCGIWRRWRASDRPSHPLVGEEPLLRRARHARAGRRGPVGGALDPDRRAARSFRRAGRDPHFLSGSGAADRREPDHLSAHHHHAVGARRQDGARL